jgi:PHP family Zn ribbon phosphoesterase
MLTQAARNTEWACDYCGRTIPKAYTHKCLEYDAAQAMTPNQTTPTDEEITEEMIEAGVAALRGFEGSYKKCVREIYLAMRRAAILAMPKGVR